MKVIVKQSGFYGGDWFDANEQAIDMNNAVAEQYLPPFGDLLQLPEAQKPVEKASAKNPNKE